MRLPPPPSPPPPPPASCELPLILRFGSAFLILSPVGLNACWPAEAESITSVTEEVAAEFEAGSQQLAAHDAVLRAALHQPQYCLHFLRPGRIIRVTEGE